MHTLYSNIVHGFNGHSSTFLKVGVPQGFNLGPILILTGASTAFAYVVAFSYGSTSLLDLYCVIKVPVCRTYCSDQFF